MTFAVEEYIPNPPEPQAILAARHGPFAYRQTAEQFAYSLLQELDLEYPIEIRVVKLD